MWDSDSCAEYWFVAAARRYLSICGYLFFDDEIGVDWNAFPAIDAWLARLKSEPRWKHPYALMPGHPRSPA